MVTVIQKRPLTAVLVALFVLSGCSDDRGGLPEETTAEGLIEKGLADAEAGNCEAAVGEITAALGSGRLNVDLVDDALLARARCLAEQGNFDAAIDDINEAVQGAGDVSAVHATRGFVLLKRGDKDAARKEYDIAKRKNPKIEVPSDLR